MCFLKRKNKKEVVLKKLSDESVEYIKSYAIKNLKITKPIDVDMFYKILDLAENDELKLTDSEGYNRTDLTDEEKTQFTKGMNFVSECSDIDVDFDDLNKRLGL